MMFSNEKIKKYYTRHILSVFVIALLITVTGGVILTSQSKNMESLEYELILIMYYGWEMSEQTQDDYDLTAVMIHEKCYGVDYGTLPESRSIENYLDKVATIEEIIEKEKLYGEQKNN